MTIIKQFAAEVVYNLRWERLHLASHTVGDISYYVAHFPSRCIATVDIHVHIHVYRPLGCE